MRIGLKFSYTVLDGNQGQDLPPPTTIGLLHNSTMASTMMTNDRSTTTTATTSQPAPDSTTFSSISTESLAPSSAAAAAAITTTSQTPPRKASASTAAVVTYPFCFLWRVLFKRPSFWTCLIAILAYWDDTALHGNFVYDDSGSVKNNVVVTGQHHHHHPSSQTSQQDASSSSAFLQYHRETLRELLKRDFWGTPLTEPQSHKSFRPVTTLTFRLNWLLANGRNTQWPSSTSTTTTTTTFGFHVVNVILHGIVTALVTEVAGIVFATDDAASVFTKQPDDMLGTTSTTTTTTTTTTALAQFLTGCLFGLHPVHAEAVSNITSRGELLMSVFFLGAFLSYAYEIQRQRRRPEASAWWRSMLYIYTIPWLCMTLSLFSKEQGASTLIALVVWDFLQHYESLVQYLPSLRGRATRSDNHPIHTLTPSSTTEIVTTNKQATCRHARYFLLRTVILAFQTIAVCALRYWMNGATSPDFIPDQNPAGFAPDRFTRHFSVSWVYCLYIWDIVCPLRLSCDWSGLSIPLIQHWSDMRIGPVLFLWFLAGWAAWSLIVGLGECGGDESLQMQRTRRARRIVLQSFFAFTFTPFLLSSNLIVVVGLMKADRVVYLPLLGCCLLQAFLFTEFCSGDGDAGDACDAKDMSEHDTSVSAKAVAEKEKAITGIVAPPKNLTWVQKAFKFIEEIRDEQQEIERQPLSAVAVAAPKQGSNMRSQVSAATISAPQSNDRPEEEPSSPQQQMPVDTKSAPQNNDRPEKEKAQHESNETQQRRSLGMRRRPRQQWSLVENKRYAVAYLLTLLQLAFYCVKLHERNLAWSDSLRLWMSAYQINPISRHTIYNCGYELSLQKRFEEAEYVLRPIGDPHVEGPSNTFVYAMVLYNLNRCEEAFHYLDRAFKVLEQKKQDLDVRNNPKSLARTESNLLVAQAFCWTQRDLPKAGKLMYRAVEVDPTNDYAIAQATSLVKKVQAAQLMQQH